MGPNGSGKSTLANALSGRPTTDITEGEILFEGKPLTDMEPEIRAREGIFVAFQYPVEIPGVASTTFLKHALNAVLRYRGQDELDAMAFVKMLRAKTKALGIADDMLKRPVNVGYSGGEKKRNEMLQMAVLEPTLAVLDETDSGLDIDALKVVADGVNSLRAPDRSMLVITHYQRLLDYIVPDHVHVLAGGRIVRSGGKELALELEKSGYAEFTGAAA
jgi:Fe-S cluster assembly ATP-binding protein